MRIAYGWSKAEVSQRMPDGATVRLEAPLTDTRGAVLFLGLCARENSGGGLVLIRPPRGPRAAPAAGKGD